VDGGIVLLVLNLGTGWGWVVKATSQPLYPQGRASVPIVQEAGRPPGPVWTATGNRKPRAPTEFRTPECPTRSELL